MENRSYLGSITKYREIGEGSFSRVYLAEYFDTMVAYKEFLCFDKTIKKIKPNIEKLTGLNENGLVLPQKLIYAKKEDEVFKGYIMDYLYQYSKLSDLKDLGYDKKVAVLKNARKSLDILHNKYKILHGDITPWNILYSKDKDDTKLIDFDLSIDLTKKEIIDKNDLTLLANNYAKYVGLDKDLDMYLFNLTTYTILNNKELFSSMSYIFNDDFGVIENNHAINILKSYKDIENSKALKKEYVIDYL